MFDENGKIDIRQVLYYVGVLVLAVGFLMVLYDALQVGIETQGVAGKTGEKLSLLGVCLLMTKRGLFGINEKNLPSPAHQRQYLQCMSVSSVVVKQFEDAHSYLWHSGALQDTKGRSVKAIGKIIGFIGTGWAIGTYTGLESLAGVALGVVGNVDTIVGFGSKRYWVFWTNKLGHVRDLWEQIEPRWKDAHPIVF